VKPKIACPACGDRKSRVTDSRGDSKGTHIRRRRECLACRARFSTDETVMPEAAAVDSPFEQTVPVSLDDPLVRMPWSTFSRLDAEGLSALETVVSISLGRGGQQKIPGFFFPSAIHEIHEAQRSVISGIRWLFSSTQGSTGSRDGPQP
jgi:hypothetical protein